MEIRYVISQISLKNNESNAFPTMQSLRNVDSEAKVEILVFGGEEDA